MLMQTSCSARCRTPEANRFGLFDTERYGVADRKGQRRWRLRMPAKEPRLFRRHPKPPSALPLAIRHTVGRSRVREMVMPDDLSRTIEADLGPILVHLASAQEQGAAAPVEVGQGNTERLRSPRDAADNGSARRADPLSAASRGDRSLSVFPCPTSTGAAAPCSCAEARCTRMGPRSASIVRDKSSGMTISRTRLRRNGGQGRLHQQC